MGIVSSYNFTYNCEYHAKAHIFAQGVYEMRYLHPASVYVLAQIGLGLLFFVVTLILYFDFKGALSELLLVLTDSQDEELVILSSYTQRNLHLFLSLLCAYLVCCVAITVTACKRRRRSNK